MMRIVLDGTVTRLFRYVLPGLGEVDWDWRIIRGSGGAGGPGGRNKVKQWVHWFSLAGTRGSRTVRTLPASSAVAYVWPPSHPG